MTDLSLPDLTTLRWCGIVQEQVEKFFDPYDYTPENVELKGELNEIYHRYADE